MPRANWWPARAMVIPMNLSVPRACMETSSTTFLMCSDGKLLEMCLSSRMSSTFAIVVAQLQPGMIVPAARKAWLTEVP
eukprot:5283954-Heterocapsa_arctica.AAC.1